MRKLKCQEIDYSEDSWVIGRSRTWMQFCMIPLFHLIMYHTIFYNKESERWMVPYILCQELWILTFRFEAEIQFIPLYDLFHITCDLLIHGGEVIQTIFQEAVVLFPSRNLLRRKKKDHEKEGHLFLGGPEEFSSDLLPENNLLKRCEVK